MAPKKSTTTTRILRTRKLTEQAPRRVEIELDPPTPPQPRKDPRGSGDSLAVNYSVGGKAYAARPRKVSKKSALKKPKPHSKPARKPQNNRASAVSTEAIAGSPPPLKGKQTLEEKPESPIMKNLKLRGKAKERAEEILGAIRAIRHAVRVENVKRREDFYDEIEEALTHAAYDFAAAVVGGVVVVAEQPEEDESEDDGSVIYCY